MRSIVLVLLLCACAKSHFRTEDDSNLHPSDVISDDYPGRIVSDEEVDVVIEDGAMSEDNTIESRHVGNAGGGSDGFSDRPFIEGDAKGPILFSIEPQKGCTNVDKVMIVNGSWLHHEAFLTISYPYSGAVAEYSPDVNAVDENGNAIYGWNDSIEMWFRTYPLMWHGMPRFVSGHYLVVVTNPDGQKSNAAGLNLQYCDDE